MKQYMKIVDLAALVALTGTLAGCDQPTEAPPETKAVAEVKPAVVVPPKALPPTATAPAPIAAPVVAPLPKISTDPLAPRYEATLEQGIDFNKPGFPTFVSAVEGLSVYEAGHRWSEGPATRFTLTNNLPGKFTLEIVAAGFGPNAGKSVKVKIGNAESQFVLAADGKPKAYAMTFNDVKDGNAIEIVSPQPISPAEHTQGQSKDTRKLAIAFVGVKILPAKSVESSKEQANQQKRK